MGYKYDQSKKHPVALRIIINQVPCSSSPAEPVHEAVRGVGRGGGGGGGGAAGLHHGEGGVGAGGDAGERGHVHP